MSVKYQRVLLKLSGEALGGASGSGIDATVIARLAAECQEILSLGIELAVVIGGGNLFRGEQLAATGVDRVTGDQVGMLATVMNALVMRDALEQAGISTRLLSAFAVAGIADQYDARRATSYLTDKKVVVFAGGTGNPFFTTDSTASLRAIETRADLLIKATKVDGVYDADPMLDKTAKRYQTLSFDDVIQNNLRVMDTAAICMCRDHQLPICVYDMTQDGALKAIVSGRTEVGTLVL